MSITQEVTQNISLLGIHNLAKEYLQAKAPKSNYNQYSHILEHHSNAYESFEIGKFPTCIKMINTLTEATAESLNVKSPTYFRKVRGLIRRFWRWLYEEGHATDLIVPTAEFKLTEEYRELKKDRVSARRERVRELTPEAVVKTIERERHIDRRTSTAIYLAYNIACRLVELPRLQRKHFVCHKEGNRYIYAVEVEGKNDRKNYGSGYTLVEIPKVLYNYVMYYMDLTGITEPDHYFFPQGSRTGLHIWDVTQPASLYSIRKFIRQAFKLHIGLDIKGHDLRRARVTELKSQGCSDEDICALCRMSIETVRRHYDYSRETHALHDTFLSIAPQGSPSLFGTSQQ